MEQTKGLGKIGQDVAGFYEEHGRDFSGTRRGAWAVMDIVASSAKPGDLVVDVGAGNARLASRLPVQVRYLAVEPSSVLREEAAKALQGRVECEVRAGSLPDLPLEDAISDVTACFAVLHHIPGERNRILAMLELARITKPGGLLVLTAWNLRSWKFRSWKNWLAAWFRLPLVGGGTAGDVMVPWANKATRYVHAFTLSELKRLFDPRLWSIEKAEAWDDSGPTSVLRAKNLVVAARRNKVT